MYTPPPFRILRRVLAKLPALDPARHNNTVQTGLSVLEGIARWFLACHALILAHHSSNLAIDPSNCPGSVSSLEILAVWAIAVVMAVACVTRSVEQASTHSE